VTADPFPAPPPRSPTSGTLVRLLKLLVGVGLLTVLFLYADPDAVMASLAGSRSGWLAAAVALVLLDRVVNAFRWLWLLRTIEPGRDVPTASVVRIFFVSGFFGTFLPGSVGGDAVRALSLSRLRVPAADALASVVVDRVLGTVSVLLMALVGLAVVHDRFSMGTVVPLAVAGSIALLAAFLVLFDQRVLLWGLRRVTAGRLSSLGRYAERALTAIGQYRHHRLALARVLAASVGVQVLRIFEAWSLGQALGVQAALLWYFPFLPIIILVMLLPISVAGLGTGAAAFQATFGTVGVPAAETFALALLFSALGLVGTLPGALLFSLGRRSAAGGGAAGSPSD